MENTNKLTLKQQIKIIYDVFRAGNKSCTEFYIKNLIHLFYGDNGNDDAFKEGILYLNNNGVVSVKDTDEGQVVTLLDFDKLFALLCDMDD